jgi:hypothetical protein
MPLQISAVAFFISEPDPTGLLTMNYFYNVRIPESHQPVIERSRNDKRDLRKMRRLDSARRPEK